ncbi:hypothetical protein ACOMHN_000377 [Nucella lapillus]
MAAPPQTPEEEVTSRHGGRGADDRGRRERQAGTSHPQLPLLLPLDPLHYLPSIMAASAINHPLWIFCLRHNLLLECREW